MRFAGTIAGCAALLLVSVGCAAQQAADPLLPGCGPEKTHYHVTHGAAAKVYPSIPSGQAAIYVIEPYDTPPGTFGTPTVRVGLDGKWVGADQGNTYIELFLSPGEHHLCARWQSRLSYLSRLLGLYNFPVEAGRRYYFQILIEPGMDGAQRPTLTLQPLPSDEGKYLISNSDPSISNPAP